MILDKREMSTMPDKGNLIPNIDQYPENNALSSQPLQVDERKLTDDEKIDAVAARILERYKEAFLELAK